MPTIYSKLESIEVQMNELLSKIKPSPNEWIEGYDVMKRLGISKRTLQTYRQEGLLPYSQVRGIYFYRNEDIDEMLKRHYIKGKK